MYAAYLDVWLSIQTCNSQVEFDLNYEDAFTFSGINSASQEVALIPGGELVSVTFDNSRDFASRLTAMRLSEIDPQWYYQRKRG